MWLLTSVLHKNLGVGKLCRRVASEMVRIQVKHGRSGHMNGADGELEFLYNCETSSTIEHIAKDTTEIANLQLQIQQLSIQLLPRLSSLLHTHHHHHPQVIGFHRAISEATSYTSKEQVVHGKPLSSLVLREHKRSIENEFTLNYQLLGLPDANLELLLSDLVPLQEDTVQLSWAGKELTKGKLLRDYIGKNDKTKIVVRLQVHVSHPACKSSTDNRCTLASFFHCSLCVWFYMSSCSCQPQLITNFVPPLVLLFDESRDGSTK